MFFFFFIFPFCTHSADEGLVCSIQHCKFEHLYLAKEKREVPFLTKYYMRYEAWTFSIPHLHSTFTHYGGFHSLLVFHTILSLPSEICIIFMFAAFFSCSNLLVALCVFFSHSIFIIIMICTQITHRTFRIIGKLYRSRTSIPMQYVK